MLESLAGEHIERLLEAAQDPGVFTWYPEDLSDPERMRSSLTTAIESARLGREVPFAILDAKTGAPAR